jgi:hypothetical protein
MDPKVIVRMEGLGEKVDLSEIEPATLLDCSTVLQPTTSQFLPRLKHVWMSVGLKSYPLNDMTRRVYVYDVDWKILIDVRFSIST